MTKKRTNDNYGRGSFWAHLRPRSIRLGPALAASGAFVASVLAVISGIGFRTRTGDLRDFEVGRVAERDIIAEETVSYVDEEATQLRLEAQERLVPAVFKFSPAATEDMRKAYGNFAGLSVDLFSNNASSEAYRYALQAEYPGAFDPGILDILYRDPSRERLLEYGLAALEYLLDTGIFALPQTGLEAYNPDMAELLHNTSPRVERERVSYDSVITIQNVGDQISRYIGGSSFPSSFGVIAEYLLRPFLTENVFFSQEDTALRVEEVRNRLEPVVRQINRGDVIIRKGFVISKEEAEKLRALNMSLARSGPGIIIGRIMILLMVFLLMIFLAGPRITGHLLKPSEVYLLSALSALYTVGAVFVAGASPGMDTMPVSIFLPTALVVMLPAILISPRVAAAMAMVLPLASFLAGSFDTTAFVFALASGLAAAYSLQGAERRMDLIKAGFLIAGANCITIFALMLMRRNSPGDYPPVLFWAAFNGLGCGMLVLGFLPLMEHLLNSATTFRLIELSDLNSPILKRLLTVAPGTYSHAVMVANLAESACQDIGANALLARVGAYYHDIGKMEQPHYFIENQNAYNKHEDIAPRLSATVIRSHVKIGVEKARNMGLPKEVVDIIAEHHGNSVISWFYNEALKRESQVNVEDFTYPGTPPRSRESAVVMLADVVEAAARTLKKPSASRLEKFIQELIMSKFENGQLSESELTFRDLETIRKAFVRVLAGHYHARIEYPKALKELPASPGGKG